MQSYAASMETIRNLLRKTDGRWTVSSSCKEQEIALKFLEYLYQDDVMLEHNIRCTQIPAKKKSGSERRVQKKKFRTRTFL